jgi:hypothetical protein
MTLNISGKLKLVKVNQKYRVFYMRVQVQFLLLKKIVCNLNSTEKNSTNEQVVLQFHEDLFNICVFW